MSAPAPLSVDEAKENRAPLSVDEAKENSGALLLPMVHQVIHTH